jgi:hypothetical protein
MKTDKTTKRSTSDGGVTQDQESTLKSKNDHVRRLVERTRREQGLLPTIEDRATLDRIATLIEDVGGLGT